MKHSAERLDDFRMAHRHRNLERNGEKEESAEAQAVAKGTPARAAQIAAAVLKGAARPLLVAALGLLAVWLIGRVMETLHDNTVFDPSLTYWFGLAVFLLLVLWAAGSAVSARQELHQARDMRLALASWAFLALLVLLLLAGFKGYRIVAAGIFAAIDGSAEYTEMATFLLFKFHSWNPLLALHLFFTKLLGLDWGLAALAPFVWSWNALFAFFIWSVAFGIVLLMQKDKRGPKSVHLFIAAFGLLGLIVLKSVATPTTTQMVVIQAMATALFVFQVLLAYAVIRALAGAGDSVQEAARADWSRATTPQKERTTTRPFIGLPPTALTLALVLVFVVPVLADLQTQLQAAASSRRMVRQVAMDGTSAAQTLVTVAAISVRSGPTIGDEVLGILPKGTQVQVLGREKEWVNIGENQWIAERFLRPVEGR